MPIDTNSIKNDLYDFLKAHSFNPTRYDSKWNKVQVSNDADIFQCHFHKDGEDYGTFTVLVDGVKKLTVFYGNEIATSPQGGGEGMSWTQLLKQLKRFAMNRQLGFELDDDDNLEDVLQKRQYDNKQKLGEGYYGTRNTSYTDNQPGTIKIILKHSRPMQEGDQRFRNIEKIFLENEHGERILAPTTKPSVGRAFARCLAEGDEVNGTRWKHITEMADEISKLGGFLRATRNKQVNESVGKLITEAQAYYESLRSSIKHLQTSRGYNNYFESWKPQLNETEDGTSVLEMFRNNSVDPRIEGALPILNRLSKNVMEMSEVNAFESWADSIVSETLKPTSMRQVDDIYELIGPDSDILNVGADAMNVIPQLHDILEDPRLYARLKKAARANPDDDARPIIIGWMEENDDNDIYGRVLKRIYAKMNDDPTDDEPKIEKPKKKEPKPDEQQPAGALPPLPAIGGAPATGAVPPPPLEEDDDKKKDDFETDDVESDDEVIQPVGGVDTDGDDEEDLFDPDAGTPQEFKSERTSINSSKLPATFGKLDQMKAVEPGMTIADIGGGRFDNAIHWAEDRDANLFIYDPFNRSIDYNKEFVKHFAKSKADIATVNNVLNVIKEPEARQKVIRQAYHVLKPGGTAYFLMYEGDKSGEGRPTQGNKSWQNNRSTASYAKEILNTFDDVAIRNGLIVAKKDESFTGPANVNETRQLRRTNTNEGALANLRRLSGLL